MNNKTLTATAEKDNDDIFSQGLKTAIERFGVDKAQYEKEIIILRMAIHNSELINYTKNDVLKFYMQIKAYNLPFNLPKLYYIYNGRNNGKPTLEISYHGYKYILATSNIMITTKLVRKEDVFMVKYDKTEMHIAGVVHKPANFFDTGMNNVIGGYILAEFHNGSKEVYFYNMDDITKSKDAASMKAIWKKHENTMSLKAMIRQGFLSIMLNGNNIIPKDLPFNQLEQDDADNYELPEKKLQAQSASIPHTIVHEEVDTATGEVVQLENNPPLVLNVYENLMQVAQQGDMAVLKATPDFKAQNDDNRQVLLDICEDAGDLS